MSDKAVTKALNRRLKQRRLPSFNIPPSADPGVAQALESIQEHLRLYEGAQGNPNERFVTLEELKNAGLVTVGTKNGFSAITSVLGETVPQAPSTSVKTSAPASDGGSSGGTPGIDDRYLRSDQGDTAQGLINFNAGWRSIQDVEIDRAVNAGRPELVLNAPESAYGRITYKEAGVAKTQLNLLATGGGTIFQIYDTENTAEIFLVADSTIEYKDNTIWHAGNDGPASGLNADLLDGFDSSDFARMANAEIIEAQWTFQSDPDISGSFTNNIALTLHEETASDVAIRFQTALSNQMFFGLSDDNELYFGDATNFSVNGWKIWHENNDGAGSGLDADTVDGIEGTSMMTFTGVQQPDLEDLADVATHTPTKGHLFVANNDVTPVWDVLSVGTNGQVLTADSVQALGVKWADIDHDALINFVAQEHIRWDLTGVEDIHVDRISETAVTQHEAALTIDHTQVVDLSSDDLSDVASIAMLDENEIVPGDWTFEATTYFEGLGNPHLRDAGVELVLENTAGGVDGKRWGLNVSGNVFSVTKRADSGSLQNTPLRMVRTGAATDEIELNATLIDINGDMDVSGDLTAATYGGISEANLLNKNANETVPGSWSVTGNWTFDVDTISDLTVNRTNATGASGLAFSNTDGIKGYLGFDDAGVFTVWDSGPVVVLTVDDSGNLTADGDVSGATIGGIIEANLVDKSATEIIAGAWTYSNAVPITFKKPAADTAQYTYYRNESNTLRWIFGISSATSDDLFIGRYNDAGVFQGAPLYFDGDEDRVEIRDGNVFRIYNSGDTDYADFSHNGVDFNTNFVNTTDWNITGASNVRIEAMTFLNEFAWVSDTGSSGNHASRKLLGLYDDRTDRYASIGTRRGAASTRIGLSFWCSFDAAPVEQMRLDESGNLTLFNGTLTVGGNQVITEESGSFTATLTGFTTTVTGTIHWYRTGNIVTLHARSAITGTSNTTGMNMTGLPAAIQPARNDTQYCNPCGRFSDGGLNTHYGVPIFFTSDAADEIEFRLLEGSASGVFDTELFTNSSTKGIQTGWTMTYRLDI